MEDKKRLTMAQPKGMKGMKRMRREEKEKEKGKGKQKQGVSVCLRFTTLDYWHEWYRMSIPGSESDLVKVLEADAGPPIDCGCAGWGSKLYSFGGSSAGKPTHQILWTDINNITSNEIVWTKHPNQMIVPRSSPIAIPVNSRIFLFGSALGDPPVPWVETFDTDTGLLTSPSHQGTCAPPKQLTLLDQNLIRTTVLSQAEILFYCDDHHLFIYQIFTDTWIEPSNLDCLFNLLTPFYPISTTNAVLGGFLYTCHQGEVYAFDLSSTRWLKNPVKGLLQLESDSGFIRNFGDDRLCVLFLSMKHGKATLYCEVFTPLVHRPHDSGEPYIQAQLEPLSTYHLYKCITCVDFIPFPSPSVMHID